MSKRLIVCCDGTWNTPDQEDRGRPAPTNVFKLHNSVAEEGGGKEQRTYYHPGVGTEGGALRRLAGGAYGKGLSENVKSAYAWLAGQWESGDEIYLFGFSRGAFTVRSLGGLISACGLSVADEHTGSPAAWWKEMDRRFEAYRAREGDSSEDVPITFIGVWDTVGALGIPNDLAILNLLDDPAKWQFHDTTLGRSVECARHAVALDEQRASFTPTLWRPGYDGQDVKQLWFPGVHSDVGGGYADCGLSDIALDWMMTEAEGKGLAFDPAMRVQVNPDPRDTLHNSVTGAFKALRTRPRAIPEVSASSPDLHGSVLERQADPPITAPRYHPSRRVAIGETELVGVYARDRWNHLGIYLEAGATYRFEASGEWLDSKIKCGPGGTNDGNFHAGEIVHMASSAWGWVESLYKKATGNEEVDFLFTRRIETEPWFSLIGVLANDGGARGTANPTNDGSPRPHETFLIGDGTELTVTDGGYLHAFANDAWSKYDNNRGSVNLKVTRTA